ncbi:uncharacterized protein N7511_004777 [Penicillium nucicola]|uniref:uncharacterized protein n=1 Tax=Penicillium nucicola TaxID=1850975 RepID=UPI0025454418|nr:uncharacterized protein N7511_004777 [Penicillium nucicola]KAJ5767161.1 hypothetical protein N7511_004777 [Penicillium nucicola]
MTLDPRATNAEISTPAVIDQNQIDEYPLTSDSSQTGTPEHVPRQQKIPSRDSPFLISSTFSEPKTTESSFLKPSKPTKSSHKPAAKRAKLTADNETEVRCQLINDINIQRSNHRNITSNDLRDIIALLIQAKKSRNPISLSDEEKEQWLEQDELMKLAADKMERGGRCSRAALSRWELFLTAPMVEEEDKKDLERIIAVEESHSAMSVSTGYNFLHIRRLQRIFQDPVAYGVKVDASRRTELTRIVKDAIENKCALTRATHKTILELLDPDKKLVKHDQPSKSSGEERGTSKPKTKAAPSSNISQQSTPLRAHSTQFHEELADVLDSPPTPSVFNSKDFLSTPTLNMPKPKNSPGNMPSRPSSLQPQQPQRPQKPTEIQKTQQASTQMKPDTPKKLINVFVEQVAPLMPIFDLDDLDRLLRMTSLHGSFAFREVDPTLSLCFALAALQSRDRAHWNSQEWYKCAEAEMKLNESSESSILAIQRRTLQVLYLQMTGDLSRAWSILSLALGLAEASGIQTVTGGPFAVDKISQQRNRVLWHSLWLIRLSLASQMGMNWQSLETRYSAPLPTNIPLGSKISRTQHTAISSFFNASVSLYKHMEDILSNDEHLRLRIDVCPFRSLFTADLCDFFELDGKLLEWKEVLPSVLHWDGTNIGLLMENDAVIRRVRVLMRLRYLSIRLRVFRPFLIFCLRLSHTCSCASGPHILTGKEAESVDSPAILGIVRDSTLKCLAAAQDIIKILTVVHGKGAGKGNDDTLRITTSSYECLDYIFTSALILIACRAIPFIAKGAGANKYISSMNEQIRHADVLLRNYEESSQQTDQLTNRIQRCREVLDLLKGQIESGLGVQNPTVFSDARVSVGQHVWKRLYDRLGLQEEISFQEASSSHSTTGRKNYFAWVESLPTDLDGWDPVKAR